MKIYTSYFAKLESIRKAGIIPVGIALYKPQWFTGSSAYSLAPMPKMFHGSITQEKYIELYQKEILDNINLYALQEQFKVFSAGQDIALLCYEKPGEFCHRHLFAKWFNGKTGFVVEEFEQPKTSLALF